MSPIIQASHFLISTLFDLLLFALILRFVFQVVRADFFNPVSQLVVKVTNPLLVPIRRVIPGYAGIDIACLLVLLAVSLVKLTALFWLQFSRWPEPMGIMVWALGDLVKMTFYLFVFAILIQAIMSWVNPYGNHPLQGVLSQLTSPIMRPFRRLIPPMGGFDITPIFALILLQVMIILIASPLAHIGMGLALQR